MGSSRGAFSGYHSLWVVMLLEADAFPARGFPEVWAGVFGEAEAGFRTRINSPRCTTHHPPPQRRPFMVGKGR